MENTGSAGEVPSPERSAADSSSTAQRPATPPHGSAAPPSPTPGAEPRWWNQDAPHDPWRNPDSAATLAQPKPATTQLATPPTPVRFADRGGLQLLIVVIALIAGLMGGAGGFFLADTLHDDGNRNVTLGESSSNVPVLAKRPPESIAGVVDKVQPSVVTIDINSQQGQGNGSGFIISKEGDILTNNHVASAAGSSGELTVRFHDGSSARAEIVGVDRGSDVAVIRVKDKKDLTPIQFGDSNSVRVGDPALAFGAPLGLSETVTAGIISAVDRPVRTGGSDPNGEAGGDEAYMAALQTDAPINPGNSGGPLSDGEGKIIGINTAIASLPGTSGGNIGVGFAVPINQAKRIAEQILSTGKATRTVIGVKLEQNFSGDGVKLGSVESGGPAEQAGLKTGDVVTKFAGRPVDGPVALIALIRKQASGDKVDVTYSRDGKSSTASVKLVDQPVG